MKNWHDIYRTLAELLSFYYNTHGRNSGTDLYKRCISDSEFRRAHSWINKFDKVFEIKSIDPIHIFASLNENKLGSRIRIERINLFFRMISPNKHHFEEIDFTGCPSPFSLKILSARNEEIQFEIWRAFDEIVRKQQRGLNQTVFDLIPKWYGIDISSFTIFLFWIDSSNFIPLDKNTNRFFLENNFYKHRPKNYNEYKRIIKKRNSDIYREIAAASYDFRNHTKDKERLLAEVNKILSEKTIREESSIDFKLVAIRPLENIDTKFSKVLIPNQVYTFFNSYDFSNLDAIKYEKIKDPKLYDINEDGNSLDVNISAIVGKNGSGKSSITELIYLAINNLTKSVLKSKCELKSVEGVYIELFYFTDSLYKLRVQNKVVELFRYENRQNVFTDSKQIRVDKNSLGSFFYSIAINYSHYALNSKDLGDWIRHLFHKNDAYQAPLVINPMRTDGNIDINIENDLVKSRLLANILEPIPELRILTENKRKAELLICSLNKEKVDLLYGKQKFPPVQYQKEIIQTVYRHFSIQTNNKNDITRCADKYIFKKLVSISRNYSHYKKYYKEKEEKFSSTLFNKYLQELSKDKSHITNKLKQAINFLKYQHLKHHDISKPIKVADLADNIEKVISENYPNEELKTIELIPPSFFKVQIKLDDDSDFEQLSSGEKQRIHTLNSLVYHLLNINSVSDNSVLSKYSYVNILFDEVELYFHPEMQRTFIDYLLKYLRKVNFNDITGLNFCFVTHSPFILSDIPDSNILFLEIDDENHKAKQKFRDDRTFGGNIHDLLKDSFFLNDGYMGDFAKDKITSSIKFLTETIEANQKSETISNKIWNKENVIQFIEIIGEPLLRNSLKDLYLQAFVHNDVEEIDKEINRLQEEKKKLLK